MSELTIGAGYAKALFDLCLARGADLQALVAASGIDPDRLSDRDARIPFEDYEALMHAGERLLGEPSLALLLGEAAVFSEISIVGLICNAAETAADAFGQIARLGRLVVEVEGADSQGRFVLKPDKHGLWLTDTRKDPNRFPQLTESAFAMMVVSQARDFDNHFALEAHFTHAEPRDRTHYDRIFRVPITFSSDRNALRVKPDFLSFRFAPEGRIHDPYVFSVFSEKGAALLEDLKQSTTMRGRVERLLLPLLHTGDITMDAIADKLGLSRQTLYRRLKGEGVSFEGVLDTLRHTMAKDYLSARKASVNETAYLTGFSDPSAFSRAFKRWEGVSPKDYREG